MINKELLVKINTWEGWGGKNREGMTEKTFGIKCTVAEGDLPRSLS